jgi:hypothetical protein
MKFRKNNIIISSLIGSKFLITLFMKSELIIFLKLLNNLIFDNVFIISLKIKCSFSIASKFIPLVIFRIYLSKYESLI